MIEEFFLAWSAAPAPQQHFFGDDLVFSAVLFDHVAATEEQQGRLARDLTGADDRRAGRAFILPGERIGHDELAELFDKAVVAAEVVIALGCRGFKTDFDELGSALFSGGQKVHELRRQVAGHNTEALLFFDDLYAEKVGKRGGDEVLHGFGIAYGLIDCAEVFLDFLGLDGVLGEDAAGGVFAFGGFVHFAGDFGFGGCGLVEFVEIESRCCRSPRFFSMRRSGLSSSAWVIVSMMLCESSGNGTLMPVARLISRTLRRSTSSTMPSMGLSAP